MKVSWIENQKDSELIRAWVELVDPVCLNDGETWQYMASEQHETWQHVFRHRCHPATGEVMFVRVPAAANWSPGWCQEVD